MYSAGAHLVALLHYLFCVLALFGGFLVLIHPAWLWIQLAIVLWSAYVFLADRPCPLTPLENSLRRRAGRPAYQGGFVQHYLMPRGTRKTVSRRAYVILGVAILLWNGIVFALVR